MSDDMPGHTCPAIDRVKQIVRKHLEAGDPDRNEAFELLEGLRADNTRLRDGYARAKREVLNLTRKRKT